EAPWRVAPHAYIPPASRAHLNDGAREVVFVEGVKKALAVEQLGHAVIGLGGVDLWKHKDTDLLPELAAIDWTGRTVFICFDYDPKPTTRRNVAGAARRLARTLQERGADCRTTNLPAGPDGGKNGVDDWLVPFPPEGRAGAMRKLLDEARPE